MRRQERVSHFKKQPETFILRHNLLLFFNVISKMKTKVGATAMPTAPVDHSFSNNLRTVWAPGKGASDTVSAGPACGSLNPGPSRGQELQRDAPFR